MPSIRESQATFRSGGKDIALDCFLPTSTEQSFPAVVALHGSGGNYSGMAEPARLLAAEGIAVYVLHYFDRTNTICADSRATILRNSPFWLKTLWDCVTFVAHQQNINPEKIGLIGFSLGAYLSLSIAAFDARIKAVVDFFGGLPKEVKPFARRYCPVLILHGDTDQTVSVQEAFDLQQILERNHVAYDMKIYPNVGHGFTGPIWQDASSRTVEFLKKYLKSN
ncbi:MAG TPA: dienelactone hydrolase family protein [Terriglobales bacterium]|nr:dienelactone hydrolase family protein [Terriglobales bacterium]